MFEINNIIKIAGSLLPHKLSDFIEKELLTKEDKFIERKN